MTLCALAVSAGQLPLICCPIQYLLLYGYCGSSLASFPDSTPKLFIAPCIKAFIHGAIKSLGVESGNEASSSYQKTIRGACFAFF